MGVTLSWSQLSRKRIPPRMVLVLRIYPGARLRYRKSTQNSWNQAKKTQVGSRRTMGTIEPSRMVVLKGIRDMADALRAVDELNSRVEVP